MSKMKLRTRIPVSYFEPDEPSFDEYIFCDQCQDVVYEYCSLHGPLLVVPDEKVTSRNDYPSFVPRAALTIPREFVHIAPSIIPGAGLGVFATLTLPSGVRFGPFVGRRSKEITQYCWKIQDRNERYKHTIDAADPDESNWLRYVNCSRHWHEQNLVAYQYQGQIYYRTIKIIPRFTELLVFYGSEFAMALSIDLRNYNSDNFCQTIVQRKCNTASTIDPEIVETIQENSAEDLSNIDFEEVNESNTNEYSTPTTIKDFVIIDTPEATIDFNSHTNECMTSESHTSPYKSETDESPQTLPYINNFTCFICRKIFDRRHSLKRHYKTHGIYDNDIELIMANIQKDSKNYNSQSNNTGTQNFDECYTQMFSYNSGITCDVCRKHFVSNYSLERHMSKMHDVKKTQNPIKKTVKCNVCNIILNSKNYARHKYIHSEKRFKCPKCPYKTNLRYELRDHIQSHTGKFMYQCDMCSYGCHRRRNIVHHLQKRHK